MLASVCVCSIRGKGSFAVKNFQILTSHNKKLLFEGKFRRFRDCLEQAVKDRVPLQGASLVKKDLSNAMLDDGCLRQADFSGANLTGANLSEARLEGASFIGADLYNTCLAWSDLRGCRFEDASFGGTDITGCDISHSIFSTLSCFSLDFTHASAMQGCAFTNPDGMIGMMSKPPVVIRGASHNIIIFMDQCVKIDHRLLDYPNGIALLKTRSRTRNLL
jgi:hypothetical protein